MSAREPKHKKEDEEDDELEEEQQEDEEEEEETTKTHKHRHHHHHNSSKPSALSTGLGASIKYNPSESSSGALSDLLLGSTGGYHTYSQEEKRGIVEHLNTSLADDEILKSRLPIPTEGDEIFPALSDGLILGRFINQLLVRHRVKLHTKTTLSLFEKNENNKKVIDASVALGLKLVNIGPSDLTDAKPESKHLALGLMWQLVARDLRHQISQLIAKYDTTPLLVHGEDLNSFLRLQPEAILLRWFNYHLENAGHDRRVSNFDQDIKDSVNYLVLIHQLGGKTHNCSLSPGLEQTDLAARAECVLQEAEKIHCRTFLTPKDIVNGETRLNFAFVANMFQKFPSLDLLHPPTPPPEPEPLAPVPAVVDAVLAVESPAAAAASETVAQVELPKTIVIPEEIVEKEKDLMRRLELQDRRAAEREVGNAKNKMWDMKAELIDHRQMQELTKDKHQRITKELELEQKKIEAEHQIRITELKQKLEKEKIKAKKREQYKDWTPEQFKRAIEVNQRHREEMERRMNELKDATAEEQQDLQMLEDENEELKGRLARLDETKEFEMKRTKKAEIRMENRVKEAQDDAEEALRKLDDVQDNIQLTESEIMHLDQQKRELEFQHEDIIAQRKQTETMLRQLEKQIEEEEQRARETKLEHQKKAKQTVATERKAVKIESEVRSVKTEVEHIKQQREELGIKAEALLDEVNQQQVETSKAKTELEVATEHMDDAQEQFDDALVEGELEVNRAVKDSKNDVEAKKRQAAVQQKKDQLKTEALHDEAVMAEKEVEKLKMAKLEAQRAENEAEQALLSTKLENRILVQQRQRAEQNIEEIAEDMQEADKEVEELSVQHQQLVSEDKLVARLTQKAKKQVDAVSEEISQAEKTAQMRKQEAEIALGAAAEAERAANRLQLKTHDIKGEIKEAEIRLQEAEEERDERMEEIEKNKKLEEMKIKKLAEQKIAKEKLKAKTLAGDKEQLTAQLEEAERQRERLAVAKAEALARQKAAETKLEAEKQKAEAAQARAADLDGLLKNAMGIVSEKQKTQESEMERKAAAERRLKRAQKMEAEKKVEKAGAVVEKQKKSELDALLQTANATKNLLANKTKKEMASLQGQHETALERVREEAEMEKQHRIEAKREEGRRREEKLQKELEEERIKADKRLKSIASTSTSSSSSTTPF